MFPDIMFFNFFIMPILAYIRNFFIMLILAYQKSCFNHSYNTNAVMKYMHIPVLTPMVQI